MLDWNGCTLNTIYGILYSDFLENENLHCNYVDRDTIWHNLYKTQHVLSHRISTHF